MMFLPICSGSFYKEGIIIGRHKDAFNTLAKKVVFDIGYFISSFSRIWKENGV